MSRPVALLTGAGRSNGIAWAIATTLAADGWDVAFSHFGDYDRRMSLGGDPDRDPAALVAELHGLGARTIALDADLADPSVPARLVAEASAELGPISALVLSHAESVDSGILDTTLESFDRHLAVNARASWLLLRAFAAQVPSAGGRVVALTSDHVVGNVPYGASKGALDRIVIAAGRELAPLGITANLVNPGPVDTGWMDDETRTALTAAQPSGRLGTPDDAARLVRFLVSDEARWITGQLIMSDGGFSI
ncbi:SDR family oxidoreductase [Agromyces cerinus]|uniref:3-oxoacyl-[acyl-carrier protein] reductase n=1 Tax=Agromyces cerinus subsp. cerinus TaxID=232089 RepID=A0A1N6DYS4_9MICO|nr:SDR family oxidoreductase [Agromyces cerinus]SIN75847.1 3-oxoacyl-[acyl-carrier protein] reductase [Agromyces cerinus subsp. cerinus]